ncbi:hypothetical protein [Pajaroellobacter abortibovis]|uniref:Uncharacterized protein n=1 Tax=Pajaroellobacter abortibovis TaxID=1882918 RepID=A0A1L6MZ49_9BACT|nr:hypothetical protein [Pajaroellobacter abortibovis]APS00665.1 hypothetical protein BCY86_08250 [Pajaroellobacter abortibovis]
MPEVVQELSMIPGPYEVQQGDFAIAGTTRMRLGYDVPRVTFKMTAGSLNTQRYFLAYHPLGAIENFVSAEAQSTQGFDPAQAARRFSLIAQQKETLAGTWQVRLLTSFYKAHFNSAGVLRLQDIEENKSSRWGLTILTRGGDSGCTQVVLELQSVRDQT